MLQQTDRRLKVLLIIEQCDPQGASVPLVGYRFYKGLAEIATVTLVTHGRNEFALRQAHPDADIVFIRESYLSQQYNKLAEYFSVVRGNVIWSLRQVLSYPIYAEFNYWVNAKFRWAIAQGKYDIVHAMTPMMPRYPVKVAQACGENRPGRTPFIMGPVNGGIPYPKGFSEVAKKELASLNFLRAVGRAVIPGYYQTYRRAAYVLSGSQYTAGLVKSLFGLSDYTVKLFPENGIDRSFLKPETLKPETLERSVHHSTVQLLFVGRLVPYKSADMLIDAVDKLASAVKQQVHLTIVGEGSERAALEQQTRSLNLSQKVTFVGWVTQPETLQYYGQADIFCFPSIREFGGAVVLEAMGNGLPCIVVDHGGIGEYVTEKTGFKIAPISREFVVSGLVERITQLVENPELRHRMAVCAITQVQDFTWDKKAKKIVDIYQRAILENTPENTTETNYDLECEDLSGSA